MYDDNQDEEWARYNYYPPQPATPQSAGPGYAPWTDPDTAAPNLSNPNQQPAGDPGPGNRWTFYDGAWRIVAMPRGTTTTNPTTPRGGGDYPTGGDGDYFNGLQMPERRPLGALNYPAFNGPQFDAPDPFSYEEFKAPSLEEAQNEPGFDYALKQGVKAYENSKAYLGTYRSGGTIKGLNDYARNMATQNYGQVYSRKADTYDRNRNNAASNYATNYGISRDVFDRNYTGAKDAYAPKARAAELEFGREWDQYAYEGDDAFRRWQTTVNANTP